MHSGFLRQLNVFPFLGQEDWGPDSSGLQQSWLCLLPWVHLRSPVTALFLFFALAAMVQLQLRLPPFPLTSFVWSQSLFQVAALFSFPSVWIAAMLLALTVVKVKE